MTDEPLKFGDIVHWRFRSSDLTLMVVAPHDPDDDDEDVVWTMALRTEDLTLRGWDAEPQRTTISGCKKIA